MPKLISTRGARDAFVPDDQPDQWRTMVGSGDWKVADGETASYVDAYGHQTVADQGVIQQDRAKGVEGTIEDQGTVIKRAREKRLEDQTSTVGSLLRGGASFGSFGISDDLFDPETIEADQLHHGVARGIGQAAVGLGTIFLDPAALLGAGAEAGRAGMAARELAMSGDALQAEHVASAISSRALLGGEATTGAERALGRARGALSESSASRAAIEAVPEDLASLDAAGLREAAKVERASLKTEAQAERSSLEELRKPQREELANQIRDMHQDLSSERPIFHAVTGADVEAIAGVKDVQVQLAKSFKAMRAGLDSPLSVARDPGVMIRPLEMRQSALEALQAKVPELQAVLGNDARAASLVHVDEALVQTREQLARIGQLSKANPVSGARLAELESGVSPRLNAIEAAQEALTKAPEAGLLQKGAQASAFAGVTALARMIPGVGIMAPFAGKWASEAVAGAFAGLAGAGAKVAARSAQAAKVFLDVGAKAARMAPVTATQVLGSVRFAEGKAPEGTQDLVGLFRARSAEIRSQTMYDPTGQVVMRPEARQAIADKLAPIASVNPLLADKLETIAVRKATYTSSKIPRQPEVGGLQIGPDNWKPSDLAMRSWARTIRAVEDPGGVEDRLAHGTVTPEDAEAYRTVYPERFAAMQQTIFQAAPQLSKTLSLKKKIALSIFTGVPLIPALQPNILQVLQGSFRTEPGTGGGAQAPKPLPAFGALGSTKSVDKPTRSQAMEGV